MRLIDADELKKDLTYDICGLPLHGNHKTNYANIRATILAQPAIDPVYAAGACYCRECIWRGREECAMFYRCDCGEQHTWETDNDFCSYGEPKEETNDR